MFRMIMIKARVNLVGDPRLFRLGQSRKEKPDGIVSRIELICDRERHDGLARVVPRERTLCFRGKVSALHAMKFRPARRQNNLGGADRIAARPEKRKRRDRERDVNEASAAKVEGEGAYPEWPYIGRIDRANPLAVRVRFEQWADASESLGLAVGERRIAARFHRASGVTRVLARAGRALASKAEFCFARVPIDQTPGDSKGIRDATH